MVIARMVGAKAVSGWIVPNDEWNATDLYNKSWIGSSRFGMINNNFETITNKDDWRMIGVAGLAAECGWQNIDDPADDLLYDSNAMSKTDWQTIGCEPGDPDQACLDAFDCVAALLRRGGKKWPKLILTARALICEARR